MGSQVYHWHYLDKTFEEVIELVKKDGLLSFAHLKSTVYERKGDCEYEILIQDGGMNLPGSIRVYQNLNDVVRVIYSIDISEIERQQIEESRN